jgi:hypothetical protein
VPKNEQKRQKWNVLERKILENDKKMDETMKNRSKKSDLYFYPKQNGTLVLDYKFPKGKSTQFVTI